MEKEAKVKQNQRKRDKYWNYWMKIKNWNKP
jgi:hypothetical protein